LDFPARFERSVACDLVFAAQRDGAERLRQAGIDSAVWLPLACDPEIHRRHEAPKEYDFAFVGNVVPGPRAELLEVLKSRYPSHFVGNAYLDEMARIYSASRIIFNRSVRNDVNMRVFEAAACGSLLVTNDLGENGQEELFRDGVHLVTYRDADELLAKIAY
jgi:spore maturation protein CgeB